MKQHSHENAAFDASATHSKGPKSTWKQNIFMEGSLKIRKTSFARMQERYCIVFGEFDKSGEFIFVLVLFKSLSVYETAQSNKPNDSIKLSSQCNMSKFYHQAQLPPSNVIDAIHSDYQLKQITKWDGKCNFHLYEYGLKIKTIDKTLHCAVSSLNEWNQWMQLIGVPLDNLLRNPSISPQKNNADKASQSAHEARSSASFQRSSSESHRRLIDSVLTIEDIPSNEWESYSPGGAMEEYKRSSPLNFDYEQVDPSLLLDEDLLTSKNKRENRFQSEPMASDEFLFEDTLTSFPSLLAEKMESHKEKSVKESKNLIDSSDSEQEDYVVQRDSVDLDLEMHAKREIAGRLAMREKQRRSRERALKLESNRNTYAELAAARLRSVRKEARQSKKAVPVVRDESGGDIAARSGKGESIASMDAHELELFENLASVSVMDDEIAPMYSESGVIEGLERIKSKNRSEMQQKTEQLEAKRKKKEMRKKKKEKELEMKMKMAEELLLQEKRLRNEEKRKRKEKRIENAKALAHSKKSDAKRKEMEKLSLAERLRHNHNEKSRGVEESALALVSDSKTSSDPIELHEISSGGHVSNPIGTAPFEPQTSTVSGSMHHAVFPGAMTYPYYPPAWMPVPLGVGMPYGYPFIYPSHHQPPTCSVPQTEENLVYGPHLPDVRPQSASPKETKNDSNASVLPELPDVVQF